MVRKRQLLRVVGLTLASSLVVACSIPQPTPTITQQPTATTPPTATLWPTATGIPVWDYIALGDSVARDVITTHAEMLEQDLSVEIRIKYWARGGDHSSRLLERLRSNKQLRQDLRRAEVITIEIPQGALEAPILEYESGEPGACGVEDNQDCLREVFRSYMADTDEIIAEVVSLRSPTEAVIRAQDVYQLMVSESKASGSFEILNGYWREINAHLVETANRYDIPVARVYDAFMGEGGMEDPRDRGLVLPDGQHPTTEGVALIVELFRALG